MRLIGRMPQHMKSVQAKPALRGRHGCASRDARHRGCGSGCCNPARRRHHACWLRIIRFNPGATEIPSRFECPCATALG